MAWAACRRRMFSLRWELARDERFRRIVRSGRSGGERRAGAFSARVQVQGLAPSHDYFYRFIAGGEASVTGRTRTLPSPQREPREFQLVLASCQHLEHGHWAAHRHIGGPSAGTAGAPGRLHL